MLVGPEAEVVDEGTRVSREHPEWFLMRDGERVKNLLDLSQPEVAEWVEKEVSRVIEEYGPDEIYWDYDPRIGIGGQRLVDGYVESTTWRYYENLYRVLESLAERYPEVRWVNCAGGGGRNDLGILQRCAHTTQVTDYSVMPRSIKMISGLSMALPPEAILFITNHIGASTRWGDYRTQMRVSLFCGNSLLGLHPVKEIGMKAMWKLTAHYVELFNGFISDVMRNCRVYHHTPELPVDKAGDWCVLEYVSEDADAAYAGIFRLEAAERDEYVFRSRGLRPETRYRVTCENSGATIVKSGEEMREGGILVRLPVPLTSELLLVSKADS